MNKIAISPEAVQKAFISRAQRMSTMWKQDHPMLAQLGLRTLDQGRNIPSELKTPLAKNIEHHILGGMHYFYPEALYSWSDKVNLGLPVKRLSTKLINTMEKKAGLLTRLFKSKNTAIPTLSTAEESKAIMDAAFEAKSKAIGHPSVKAESQKAFDAFMKSRKLQ